MLEDSAEYIVLCLSCEKNHEDVIHTFLKCEIVLALWFLVARWCELQILIFSEVDEIFDRLDIMLFMISRRKWMKAIILTLFWVTWRFRNSIIFGSNSTRKDSFGELIQNNSFQWYEPINHKATI